MTTFLLIVAIIILVCVMLNGVSSKLGIPMLLAFILFGMFLGTDGLFKIPFDNVHIAEKICSTALIFIMFYGGFGTKWSKAKPVAAQAILLSTVGVFLTAAFVGLLCYFVLRMELLESFLLGSVISSTDAASVFSILRSRKLNLKYNTASLLELESGSNDPCSYMLTIIVLTLMSGKITGGKVVYMLFAQIVYALVIGTVIALLALFVLRRIKFHTDGFDLIFVMAIALLAYAVPNLVGGNGYISVYVVGIILGNNYIPSKTPLIHFFDGVTGLMQVTIFFLLGLLAYPSKILAELLTSFFIALFLTFVARPIAVYLLLAPFKAKWNQQLIVSWAGFRGAASIVFAIMATIHPAYIKNDVFHMVFGIVLFSIAIQGFLLPFLSKKLQMIDDTEDVLKTFTDYTEEVPIQFIELRITPNHPWVQKRVKEIDLPEEIIFALIVRNGEKINPRGKTMLMENDILILGGRAIETDISNSFTEIEVTKDSHWDQKTIAELSIDSDKLILMIKRKDSIIIPRGKTVVKEDDIIVVSNAN